MARKVYVYVCSNAHVTVGRHALCQEPLRAIERVFGTEHVCARHREKVLVPPAVRDAALAAAKLSGQQAAFRLVYKANQRRLREFIQPFILRFLLDGPLRNLPPGTVLP